MNITNSGRAHRYVSACASRRLRSVCCCLLSVILAVTSACAFKNEPDEQAALGAAPAATEQDVVAAARKGLGTPYRFGGTSPQTGFDCSGLVLWSYEQVGIRLPRSAREQIRFGMPVQRKEDLKPGDIVVFKGIRSRTGWHSGIYAGKGKFIHSPRRGKVVTESGMDEEYFARRFAGARRIPRDGSEKALYAAYLEKVKSEAAAGAGSSAGKKVKSGKKHPARQAKASGHVAHKNAGPRRHSADKHASAAKSRSAPAGQTVSASKKQQFPAKPVAAASKKQQAPAKQSSSLTKKQQIPARPVAAASRKHQAPAGQSSSATKKQQTPAKQTVAAAKQAHKQVNGLP
jgi:cell wall-associated NlpC family hydrolase